MKIIIKVSLISFLFISCIPNKSSEVHSDRRLTLFEKTTKKDIEHKYILTNLNTSDFFIIEEVLNNAINNGEFYFLKKASLNDLKKYYRQYVVYLNQNNEKCVYINAMCNVDIIPNWKQELLDISDGGSCYWNLKINLSKRIYQNLIVNGQG
ncbi:hypothetical protein [uncultured Flavobacterium sp.]|uniref:hypothetical protein n=1 Tax=uncultured Flavobacterium sp. TaxID=165435 RepID=UPI0030ECDCE1